MTSYKHVAIQSVAAVDAPQRVTSAWIEDQLAPAARRLGLASGTIRMLTGVLARRMWDEGVMPSDAATLAAEQALELASVPRERIGICINTSVCKDYLEPSVASTVHSNLGLAPDCLNFDVGNACLAFLNGMEIVAALIERGQIDYGLIVDGEGSREILSATIGRLLAHDSQPQDLRDDFATLTLGSGAAAMVMCRDDFATTTHRFRGGVALAATQHNKLCRGDASRMVTDAGQLLQAGVAPATETWGRAQQELGWRPDNVDEIIMHQVGSMHMNTLLNALGLDPVLAHVTYSEYGNIGPAAIPFTLARSAEAGRLQSGDRVALMGIGSGLNCAMMEVEW